MFAIDLPSPRAPVHGMAYVGDITITSTHNSTSAAKKCIKLYKHTTIPTYSLFHGQHITISH